MTYMSHMSWASRAELEVAATFSVVTGGRPRDCIYGYPGLT